MMCLPVVFDREKTLEEMAASASLQQGGRWQAGFRFAQQGGLRQGRVRD
jgi:hypothetical protein